jgi:L-lysine exporter family protein LysE/ArgO
MPISGRGKVRLSTAIHLFVKGVIVGLGAAMPIGPVNVEIARRALRGGFFAGFALGCGAVTVDVFYAIVTSFGLEHLISRPIFYWLITVGGLVLLAYLSIMSLRAAVKAARGRGVTLDGPHESAGRKTRGYVTGVFMTLLNPMTLGFWFVIVPATLGRITDRPGDDMPIICMGVFSGTLAWVLFFAGVIAFLGQWRRNWWLVAADAVGGTLLLAFAVVLFLRSIGPFL